jgi:hypothetical protein
MRKKHGIAGFRKRWIAAKDPLGTGQLAAELDHRAAAGSIVAVPAKAARGESTADDRGNVIILSKKIPQWTSSICAILSGTKIMQNMLGERVPLQRPQRAPIVSATRGSGADECGAAVAKRYA